jgi:tRNA A-37 threonylcarbamoyl transferase component Bud32
MTTVIDTSAFYMDGLDLRRIRSQMSDQHRIVFTHGDLTRRSIFLKGDRVVAVIDWGACGVVSGTLGVRNFRMLDEAPRG